MDNKIRLSPEILAQASRIGEQKQMTGREVIELVFTEYCHLVESTPPSPTLEFVTPKRASAMLGVRSRTLAQWEACGKIKTYRTIGGRRRYAMESIRELQNQLRRNDGTN